MCALKICLTRTIFAFAVLCALPFANFADTPTTMNDIDFMKFIAAMMQKYPHDSVTEMSGGDSVKQPNLLYEPYWWTVNELPWEQKCFACAEVFKRYESVCAVDKTGDVFVNISMCGLMRQNCLNGIVNGKTTGKITEFKRDVFVVADGWARFAIRQELDAVIYFSSSQDPTKYPSIRAVLDGWRGSKSILMRNNNYVQTYTNGRWKDRALGRKGSYIEFVARWNSTSGWFLLTKSSYSNWTRGFNFNWTDPYPFPIKFITITGSAGNTGDWIIKGFVVTNMGACGASMGVANPLPTNPTEIPPIIAGVSPINKQYFQRLKDAGIDPTNISVVTAEEY